jgi:hypothetical protein
MSMSDSSLLGTAEMARLERYLDVSVFRHNLIGSNLANVDTPGYAGRLGADEVQIVRCGSYAWVRLMVAHTHSDLLFNIDHATSARVSRAFDEFAAVE